MRVLIKVCKACRNNYVMNVYVRTTPLLNSGALSRKSNTMFLMNVCITRASIGALKAD